jgi:hypothetical protein
VTREGEERWFALLDPAQAEHEAGSAHWSWQWTPPPLEPTQLEEQSQILSFRAALVDDDQQVYAVSSNALEVVCARRGWGC